MAVELLDTKEASRRLGIRRASFYEWLRRSRAGEFVLRGEYFEIVHFQGGARGQGRILVPALEVERLLDLMRVRPRRPPKSPRSATPSLQHISAPLGRPDDDP